MERFRPDSLWDALLRPFLMADPTSFLYVEIMAPDWRFAAITMLGFFGLLLRKRSAALSSVQWRVVVVLIVVFYVWTFTSGNGRYFLPGLLLAGPVLVLFMRNLPVTRSMRAFVLLLVVGFHLMAIVEFHHDDPWRVSEWYEGPAINLAPSPLRDEPAVFLKVSVNAFSAVTPHFHPDSRWVRLGVHLRRDLGSYEHRRLSEMFASKLKKYAFVPMSPDNTTPSGQPIPDIRGAMANVVAPYGFALADTTCDIINVSAPGPGREARLGGAAGFWLCPVDRVGDIAQVSSLRLTIPQSHQAVFERFEQECPRFFSPGGGIDTHFENATGRYYPGTDTGLQISSKGVVSYRHLRSLNFTTVATSEQILQHKIEVPCRRLVGRYQPPWLQDK